jgi:hypothetical protein
MFYVAQILNISTFSLNRFCRSAGYFAEVPKTGKFPKKLCFRFGPKAYGWKGVVEML